MSFFFKPEFSLREVAHWTGSVSARRVQRTTHWRVELRPKAQTKKHTMAATITTRLKSRVAASWGCRGGGVELGVGDGGRASDMAWEALS